MGIEQNLQYLAKGGGCFLAGTLVATPSGDKPIEELRAGDLVVSYNEKTQQKEISEIGSIDVLTRDAYYVINGNVKATAEHPFYTTNGVQEVQYFDSTTRLINIEGEEVGILSYQKVQESVTVYNLLDVSPNNNYYAANYLVHNKGGGSRGGGSKSSSSKGSSSSKSSGSSSNKSTSKSTGKSKPTAADKAANKSNSKNTTSSKTAPGSKVTANGKEVQTSSKKPTNSKVSNQAGITGVDGYSPRFNNGYTPPAGSVVYYPQHSALDYLPWIYLFSQHSPANDSATTVEPSGREVTAQPVKEGVDGLAVFNWILLIAMVVAIVAGIIWGVNKLTNKGSSRGYY